MVVAAIILAVVIIVVIMTMLLRRQLREKYGVLWLLIGVVVLILGLFPGLLSWLARLVGVQVPSNLLFALTLLLLLGVALHLSWELSRSEDEARRLAEEIALIRAEVDALRGSTSARRSIGDSSGSEPNDQRTEDRKDGQEPPDSTTDDG